MSKIKKYPHLDICATELPDLLDLGPALANQTPALAGGHNQLEAHSLSAVSGARASALLILHPVTYESVGL